MMTSVTLPSSSGPMHGGGFSTAVADEAPRPVKRCLATSLTDSCKKRRKQATPVRISAADSPPEGKPLAPSPEPESRCPVCQLVFASPEVLQNHLTAEHVSSFECKKEPPEDNPSAPSSGELPDQLQKPDMPWMSELPSKDWINPNLLSFTPPNHMFMGLPPFTQPDSMPARQPIRIFNPDAYCELCNKEFCNKYFLKTHKANKHGIYSDPPATDSSNQMGPAVNIPSYATSMKLPTSVPSVDQAPPIKIESKQPANMVSPYPEIYPNPFASKIFSKIAKPNVPPLFEPDNQDVNSLNGLSTSDNDQRPSNEHEQVAEESTSPRIVLEGISQIKQELPTSEQDQMFYTPTSKLSPNQQQARDLDMSNRLRRIGVMNPKAFCEICCKEYCNKYFLRTHKMKRHGIFIPDDRDQKDQKLETVGMPYIQTSPLNLIMAEQQSNIDRKTSSPSDISCEQCGIKFQNTSLLQLHNVSVHSKQSQPNNQETSSDDKKLDNNIDKSNDTISEDLQKLQTMILQLNDLDVNKANSTCTTCNKEFENRYYLHAHMMTEHGLLLEDNTDVEKHNEGDTNINNNTMCDLCGKDFQNFEDMKKHIMEAHRTTQSTPEVKEEFNNGFPAPEKVAVRTPVQTGQVTERRASMNLTPTSSYCEICNKELCNKYFMKTHMQRMHGIEIENGAQIGGVICDICNKELCSKYFLRVHKHNTHGIVEYGTSLLQPRKCEDNNTQPMPPIEPDPALKPADLADLSHRYFTHFTEVCTICSRRFRSTKWLKAHLLSDHGQAGAEKWAELEQQLQHTMNKSSTSTATTMKSQGERISPTLKIPSSGADQIAHQKVGLQNVLSSIFGADDSAAKTYHCSYCPFSTPVLPFLFVHERSHSLQGSEGGENMQLKCPVCLQAFSQPDLLQHHIFSQHPFLPLPPFFNGHAESQGDVSKEPSESADDAEEATEASKQQQQQKQQMKKGGGTKRKVSRADVPAEMDQTLKDVAKKMQLPATYAIPQNQNDETAPPAPAGYIMQAFLVEESAPQAGPGEHKVMPSIVFLPVLQKLSAPITATFTLTPA